MGPMVTDPITTVMPMGPAVMVPMAPAHVIGADLVKSDSVRGNRRGEGSTPEPESEGGR
jgi:hypothetical protein